MKMFLLGFLVAIIALLWIALAVMGVISIKVAVIVPACIILGFVICAMIVAPLCLPLSLVSRRGRRFCFPRKLIKKNAQEAL